MDYYADHSRISNSMKEDFLSSPPYYYGRYVGHTIGPSEPSPQMILGSAVHTLTLEPGKGLVVAPPDVDRRTLKGKAEYAAFCQANGGKLIVTQEQLALANQLTSKLLGHEEAGPLIRGIAEPEKVLHWDDKESGLPLKAKLDGVSGDVIVDIKTTKDCTPYAWAKDALDYGYHRQASWYLSSGAGTEFLFLVVQTTAPYEVVVCRLDRDALLLGARQNAAALSELAACYSFESWESRYAAGIYTVGFPSWAYR